MRARRRSTMVISCSCPLFPRKLKVIELPSISTWRLRRVVSPKDLFSRAYSTFPMRMKVVSSSRTTVASSFSRCNQGAPNRAERAPGWLVERAASGFRNVAETGDGGGCDGIGWKHQPLPARRFIPGQMPIGDHPDRTKLPHAYAKADRPDLRELRRRRFPLFERVDRRSRPARKT